MRIDLHSHSTCSDGTDTPAGLLQRAARLAVDVLALTDHDTTVGWAQAQSEADRLGVELVPGIEISSVHRHHSVHLLGYGIDPEEPELAQALHKTRQGRDGRLAGMLRRLEDLGVPVTAEQVRRAQGDSPSLGRPHVADALVAAGWVADRKEAFDRYLADGGPAYVTRWSPSLEYAIELVIGAGGVPVIAHPWGRGSREVLDARTLTGLAEAGLAGWEVDHHDHDAEERARLRRLATRVGVLGTGSSDYHGLGKYNHELASNTTSVDVWQELRDRMG